MHASARKRTYLIDLRELGDLWSMKHSQGQADHLQVLTSRRRGNVSRLRPNVVDDCLLQPGDQEMCTLIDDLLLHTRQPVEDHGARTALDIVHGVLDEPEPTGGGDHPLVDIVESVGRHRCRAGD